MKSWFRCQGSGKTVETTLADFVSYDIYAIGTQVDIILTRGILIMFNNV